MGETTADRLWVKRWSRLMLELKYPTLLILLRLYLYLPVEWYYNQDETSGVKSQDPKVSKLKSEIISRKKRPEEDHDLAAQLARSPLNSCSPCDLQRNLQHYHLHTAIIYWWEKGPLGVPGSDVATPSLLCHKDTAQGTQIPQLVAFLAFFSVFMA